MMNEVEKIVTHHQSDANRLMDMLIDIQDKFGYISDEVDVLQTLTFYHFFTRTPKGKFTIYLNNSVTSYMNGYEKVAEAFEQSAGCKFGKKTKDNLIGLYNTSCIGMCDQEPAAIINNKVFPNLTPEKAKTIIANIKAGKPLEEISTDKLGDGNNSNPLVQATVNNNIRKKGIILDDSYILGSGLKNTISMEDLEVINEIENSNLRGRGGAGFPTGLKWKFCAKSPEGERYIFCNADEGEPGTFKDRVILTEKPEVLFEGMAIAGYALKAKIGILYLRYEYKYLKKYLENVLKQMRQKKLLGKDILDKKGFDFDIRIQLGAGAYVCGEETALLESAEGNRGEPRFKPPFPAIKGYKEKSTAINNVETLCAVTRILEKGNYWFKKSGTEQSTGTKLLSVSGDCEKPGVYEVDWGTTIDEMLDMVGAEEPQAVQVGGPSGNCIACDDFSRKICYSDLATGGAMIVIGKKRDLLKDVILNYMEFFTEESCGSCVPCRNLTSIYHDTLQKVIDGKAQQKDLDNMLHWEKVMKMNRCGLGQTACNPIVTTLKNFPEIYKEKIQEDSDYIPTFDIQAAIKDYCDTTGRKPIIEE